MLLKYFILSLIAFFFTLCKPNQEVIAQHFNLAASEQSSKSKKTLLRSIEVNVGAGSTNYIIEGKEGFTFDSESRIGYYAGIFFGLPYINLGIIYSEKHALIQASVIEKESINRYVALRLSYELGIEFQKSFSLNIDVGIYGGFLLSTNAEEVIPLKNFDFGLDTKFYAEISLTKRASLTAGVRYERGGLNNLGSNSKVSRISSSIFYFYAGLKFLL